MTQFAKYLLSKLLQAIGPGTPGCRSREAEQALRRELRMLGGA